MHRYIFIPGTLLLMQACSAPETTPLPSANETTAGSLLDRLPGAWVHEDLVNNFRFEEYWSLSDDGTFQGLGVVRSGMDTVMIEYLGIQRTDSGTWYSARIPSQNAGDTVFFQMVHEVDSLVFVNEGHDFPQRIVYQPDGERGWHVRLNGHKDGKERKESLRFGTMAPAANSSH